MQKHGNVLKKHAAVIEEHCDVIEEPGDVLRERFLNRFATIFKHATDAGNVNHQFTR